MDDQMVEEQGMRFANRAYLYRLFHIVFGAEPRGEVLSALASSEAADAFGHLASTTEAAQVPIEVGGRTRIASDVLADMAELLGSLDGKADDAAYIESLKSEFTRLFLVPGETYVYLWESPYIGKETMLFQESTLDVRSRYAEYGFAAVEFGHFPEDHLSMMLDFLAHLSDQAFDAFGDGRDEEVARILSSQRDFVATHLTDWLPAFQTSLDEKDPEGIYCRFGAALQAFLQTDALFMDGARTAF